MTLHETNVTQDRARSASKPIESLRDATERFQRHNDALAVRYPEISRESGRIRIRAQLDEARRSARVNDMHGAVSSLIGAIAQLTEVP